MLPKFPGDAPRDLSKAVESVRVLVDQRLDGQRLDLIANHYLADPLAFWVLCDANGTVAPDALAAAPRVGIPAASR